MFLALSPIDPAKRHAGPHQQLSSVLALNENSKKQRMVTLLEDTNLLTQE